MKGIPHTEEWKAKLRERMKGFRHTQETKAKMRKHTLNESAFDTLTEEAAYWLGYLITRGSISFKKHAPNAPVIRAISTVQDKDHIDIKYREFVGSSHKLQYLKKKNEYEIDFRSEKVGNKLINTYGIKPKKRYCQKADRSLQSNRHFWRGVIDGHGELSSENGTNPILRLKSGLDLVLQFKAFVENNIGHKIDEPKREYKNFTINIKNENAVKAIKLLYDNCSTSAVLNRNLNVAQQTSPLTCIKKSQFEQSYNLFKETQRSPDLIESREVSINSHESAQFYLLEIGNKLNFKTYTPDVSKEFNGRKLGDVASTNTLSDQFTRDVHNEEYPCLCFEIENTTDFKKAFFRFNELRRYDVKFFFVAPEFRRIDFHNLMKNNLLKVIKERFQFISYEELAKLYESLIPCHNLIEKLLGKKLTLYPP